MCVCVCVCSHRAESHYQSPGSADAVIDALERQWTGTGDVTHSVTSPAESVTGSATTTTAMTTNTNTGKTEDTQGAWVQVRGQWATGACADTCVCAHVTS